MKTLIAPLLFILSVFPKELSSVICCGEPSVIDLPAINIPANVLRENGELLANHPKVALDKNHQYIIGFAEEAPRGDYIFTPMMAEITGFAGRLENIKLRIEGETAQIYVRIWPGNPIIRMYHRKISKSRVRQACLVRNLNIPNPAAIPLPWYTDSPPQHASNSYLHASSPSGQQSPSSGHLSPSSMWSSSFRHDPPPQVQPR